MWSVTRALSRRTAAAWQFSAPVGRVVGRGGDEERLATPNRARVLTVKNPWLRGDLVRHLGDIASSWRDPKALDIDIDVVDEAEEEEDEFDRFSFGGGSSPDPEQQPLALAVRFLFETSRFTVDPESTLGFILENLEELGAVVDVIESMHRAFKVHGMNLDDINLRNSKQWKTVSENARYAFNLLASVEL